MLIFLNYVLVKSGSTKSIGMLDITLLGLATVLPPFPIAIVVFSLYFNFDPYFYILGDIVAYFNIDNSSVFIFWVCIVMRGVLLLCSFECCRTISLVTMLVIHAVDILQTNIQNLLNYKILNIAVVTICFRKLRKLIIVYINFKSFLQACITNLLTTGFWTIVIGTWMIIKAYHQVPFLMYVTFFNTIVNFFLAMALFLKIMSAFCTSSDLLTMTLKQNTNRLYANCRTVTSRKESLMAKKVSRAVITLKICFEPFLVIDEQFCKNTIQNLLDRILDGLLMV